MDTSTLIPPQYIGTVLGVLVVVKILDEIVRAIPDKWVAGHTTIQAVLIGLRGLTAWALRLKPPVPPAALLVLVLGASACATPYPALTAAARSGQAAIVTFEQYDRQHKRELITAHPECKTAPMPEACYQAALAPYAVERDQVLSRIEALSPALTEAAHVAQQADADRSLTDALAARVAALTAAVLKAIATLRGAP